MDDCWFASSSKQVSRESTIEFGPRSMHAKEIHTTITKVWEDRQKLPVVACSYMHHHQIVTAILEHKESESGDGIYAIKNST
eukprot:4888707-Ditylum_brightwellii.AAC.1